MIYYGWINNQLEPGQLPLYTNVARSTSDTSGQDQAQAQAQPEQSTTTGSDKDDGNAAAAALTEGTI